MPSLTVTSVYRRASTIVRPTIQSSPSGHQFLRITRRALRAAEARCAYPGSDGINIDTMPAIDGFGHWHAMPEGDVVAWRTLEP